MKMGIRIAIELNTEGADLTDLILTRAVLRQIDQGFQEEEIETPEIITDKLSEISAEITNRNRADLMKRLRLAKQRRESFSSREEKAKKLDEDIAKLEGKLGVGGK